MKSNEYKTIFHTQHGQIESQVMLFRLTNTTAKFESYIDDWLQRFIANFGVCYHDDILIHSTHQDTHDERIQEVLKQQPEFGLNAKTEKCHARV
jgi:hypothetical protein